MLTQYFYDGDGQRVKKVVPDTGEVTVFVYDAGGKLAAEYSTIVEAAQDAKVSYLTNDHLGSPRINTDASGAVNVRHDYHPFGEEIDGTGGRTTGLGYASDTVRKQFTGYERDNETELDFAQARMFGYSLGRFTSPDNFLNSTRPGNPATWNLYSFVLNNPLRYVDPSGELEKDANGNVIFHKTGTGQFVEKGELRDGSGKVVKIGGKTVYTKVTYSYDTGYVKANDGTKIEASKATSSVKVELVNKDGSPMTFDKNDVAANQQLAGWQNAVDNMGYDATSDCHGVSFAEGQVWINNDQVPKILKGDGYRQIDLDSEQLFAGDIFIFSKDGSIDPEMIEHSVTLNNPEAGTVTSKGGYTRLRRDAVLAPGGTNSAWNKNPKAVITGWTLRAKPSN
ncbi:MAG: RHS repeat-associated core domain-containing protein [Acidobacteria bacterium]|nr:RHS repeat-associated core domain-containing protein [Acidobacteriota bacterium]